MSEHGPTEDEGHSHEWRVFQQVDGPDYQKCITCAATDYGSPEPTTNEPDIAEFLTQRWDEKLASISHWSGCQSPTGGQCSCKGSLGERNSYVLADIAAKRQILETFTDMDTLPKGERVEQRVTLRWVCELLAAPFASHADFDDSWVLSREDEG